MDKIGLLENLCTEKGIAFTRDVPLAKRCTFKIGGPADILIEPATEEEITAVQVFAAEKEIPLLLLGRGSNMLFSDEGFRGGVICLGQRFSGVKRLGDNRIACQSGVNLIRLCEFAREHSLSGLEFAYGIPGTVGGAIYMNAGAYGGEMKDVLRSTRHICPDGSAGELSGRAMDLSYRHSAYSGGENVVTGGVFLLQKGEPEEIRAKMDDFMERRRTKQPLEYPSAGSTFKRPVGGYASALIDQCGLKGRQVGGAQVSEKHAGFVVNRGGATCKDVLELMELVRETVEKETGFLLEPEVKIIGP